MTYDEVAQHLSALLGRPIDFVPVPDDAAIAQLVGAGLPEWFVTNMVTVFGFLRAGAQAQANDVVRV